MTPDYKRWLDDIQINDRVWVCKLTDPTLGYIAIVRAIESNRMTIARVAHGKQRYKPVFVSRLSGLAMDAHPAVEMITPLDLNVDVDLDRIRQRARDVLHAAEARIDTLGREQLEMLTVLLDGWPSPNIKPH